MTVSVHLTNYNTIISTLATLKVEIISCVITGFTMIPLSPTFDKTYVVSLPAETIDIDGASNTT